MHELSTGPPRPPRSRRHLGAALVVSVVVLVSLFVASTVSFQRSLTAPIAGAAEAPVARPNHVIAAGSRTSSAAR
jgi:hypothetical protein